MAQPLKDMELKEKVSQDSFLQVIRQWKEAIENKRDVTITVKDQQCTIPADAISKAKLEVEYEIDAGEYEFQLTMKWRD